MLNRMRVMNSWWSPKGLNSNGFFFKKFTDFKVEMSARETDSTDSKANKTSGKNSVVV